MASNLPMSGHRILDDATGAAPGSTGAAFRARAAIVYNRCSDVSGR
jgi:hypothetical protein